MIHKCFIPVKSNSTRAPNKNFALIGGVPLWQITLKKAIAVFGAENTYVDTDCEKLKNILYFEYPDVNVIHRRPDLALATANGNHLLCHWRTLVYADYYWQWYITSPFLTMETVFKMIKAVEEYESASTTTIQFLNDFLWTEGTPNYKTDVLPRSQDLPSTFRETTGIYGTHNAVIDFCECRLGGEINFVSVDSLEALDINTQDDLELAKIIGKAIQNATPV